MIIDAFLAYLHTEHIQVAQRNRARYYHRVVKKKQNTVICDTPCEVGPKVVKTLRICTDWPNLECPTFAQRWEQITIELRSR